MCVPPLLTPLQFVMFGAPAQGKSRCEILVRFDGIIFMLSYLQKEGFQMFSDISWLKSGHSDQCILLFQLELLESSDS